MNKLIKLSIDHYIIINDSEIKENDFVFDGKKISIWTENDSADCFYNPSLIKNKGCFKITHSTKPLNGIVWNNIIPFDVSEIEELIYGYSNYELFRKVDTTAEKYEYEHWLFKKGFETHQELVKDNLFIKPKGNEIKQITREEANSVPHFQSSNGEFFTIELELLLPKTEWDITFDEQGKIVLL